MKAVFASEEKSIDSPVSQVFGRAANFIFVDTETLELSVAANPAVDEGGGAGIKAAEFVVNSGVKAAVSGNFGPNAFLVLQAAEILCYSVEAVSVKDAVESLKAGRLVSLNSASAEEHSGMRKAGLSAAGAYQGHERSKESELAELRGVLKNLRATLSKTMARIEKLEKED